MNTIKMYASFERPDARIVANNVKLHAPTGHVMGVEHALIDATVDPEEISARDPRVQAVARFLAAHLTTTLWGAQAERALRLVGVNRQTERDRAVFGEITPRIEWRFEMLRFHDSPKDYLVRQARAIVRLHEREGVRYAEVGDARLDFADLGDTRA